MRNFEVKPEHLKDIFRTYKNEMPFFENLNFEQFIKLYQLAIFEEIGYTLNQTNELLLDISEEVESLMKNN